LAGDRAVADTTLNIPHPYEDGAAEKWIGNHRDWFECGEQVVFAVTLKTDGTLLGAVGLRIQREDQRAELGYWIGKPYWGQGYATEAARAAVQFGFGRLGLNRIYAHHFSRNPASGHVMRKLGMALEGHLPQHVRKWDAFEDLELYGIPQEPMGRSPLLPERAKGEGDWRKRLDVLLRDRRSPHPGPSSKGEGRRLTQRPDDPAHPFDQLVHLVPIRLAVLAVAAEVPHVPRRWM